MARQPFVMELPLAAPARCEVQAVIRFLNAKGVKPIEIHRQLTEVYGQSCMDFKKSVSALGTLQLVAWKFKMMKEAGDR